MSTTPPLPPGPPGRLFSGHLREFRRDMLGFYQRISRQFGDLVRFRLVHRRVYLANHPDLIEQVLVHRARDFQKHYAVRMNRLLLGNGMLSSEGDFWLRQRRLAQPAFSRERLLGYGAIMTDYAGRMLAGWGEGKVVDIHEEMASLALAIAARTLFDADVCGEASDVGEALNEAQNYFLARFHSLAPLPEWVPTPGNLRLRRAVRRLDKLVYRFIEERHRREASGSPPRDDLLSRLLHARDEEDGSRMTDRQLRDEAMTLFLAGHETTALVMSWTWYLLARHPEVDARLHAEVREVLGDRPPTVEDLPKLRYADHIIHESMRLYPPAYAIGREALSDSELGGCRLPRGTSVILCQWLTQRDPRWYDDPVKFLPERWEGGRLLKNLPKYAYFPFGGGPRVCIGNSFAMIESVLLLTAMAQRYRMELLDTEPVPLRPSITLRPGRPIRLKLHAR